MFHPQTLGEHIKNARIKKGLLQRHVAQLLDVCEDTITGWENNRSTPLLYHFPAIIQFLGYYPFTHETESVVGKLRQWRFYNGLTHDKSSKVLKADSKTISGWEQKTKMPSSKRCQQITKLWLKLPDYIRR